MGLFKKKETRDVGAGAIADIITASLGDTKASAEIAMQIPTVARCVHMIAGAVASLPVRLYRRVDGNVEEITEDKRLDMLNFRTGDTLNADYMRYSWVKDYLLHGNAYGYIETNYGIANRIYYIPPYEVNVLRLDVDIIHKTFSYQIRGKNIYPFQLLKVLRNSDGFGKGKGVIADSPKILNTAYNMINFENNQLLRGGSKRGVLKTVGAKKEEIAKLKQVWRQIYSPDNTTENVAVLNGDVDFKELSASNVEMQYNETMNTIDNELLKLFGTVDGLLSPDTVKNAVMPVIDAFEAAFDEDLLTEDEKGTYYFAFDTRELTRGSITERYSAYATALQNNIMLLDEVRAQEDLPPLDFDYIKLGLNDVLYNPVTKVIFNSNSSTASDLGNDGADTGLTEDENSVIIDIDKETGEETPTKRATTHFSKTGSHVVPSDPKGGSKNDKIK